MTVAPSLIRIVRDDQRQICGDIDLVHCEVLGFEIISLGQGDEGVAMSIPHAIAVHAALGTLIQEISNRG